MKIAVISSHTSSLIWFRMDMMKEFVNLGHNVIALGPDSEKDWLDKFQENGVQYKQFFVERNGINPINDLNTFFQLKKILKDENPDKVFIYHAKTIIYGTLASKVNGITEVYSLVGGLGSIFRGQGVKNKIIKTIMQIELRIAFSLNRVVFFQNEDDKKAFLDNGIISMNRIVTINGSGVNLDKFKHEPIPEAPAFLFIGRLIKDKGIIEYLTACEEVRKEFPDTRCMLVGPFDSNPSALRPEELQPFIERGVIEYFGEQSDVRPFLKQCTTFVLPSYHEGTPKTVLEAMATGRSIITSDAPGCRETVINGYNGFLVPVRDIGGLVKMMKMTLVDVEVNRIMAERSLVIVKDKFDVKRINTSIIKAMRL